MAIWDFIEKQFKVTENKKLGTLESKLRENFPNETEDKLSEIACLSGLLARVAFVDLNIEEAEKKRISFSLEKWIQLTPEIANKITHITCQEIEKLAGTENHLYTRFLKDNLPTNKRYQILEMLFSVAASDGNADNAESEEIRIISKGLGLEHHHFIAARASVKDFLGSLKGN